MSELSSHPRRFGRRLGSWAGWWGWSVSVKRNHGFRIILCDGFQHSESPMESLVRAPLGVLLDGFDYFMDRDCSKLVAISVFLHRCVAIFGVEVDEGPASFLFTIPPRHRVNGRIVSRFTEVNHCVDAKPRMAVVYA